MSMQTTQNHSSSSSLEGITDVCLFMASFLVLHPADYFFTIELLLRLSLTFFASSSASFSLIDVAVNISDRRFFFSFWVPFLGPAFGTGRTSIGLNRGLTVEPHGSSAEASGLMQITVVSTTPQVLRAFEQWRIKEGGAG